MNSEYSIGINKLFESLISFSTENKNIPNLLLKLEDNDLAQVKELMYINTLYPNLSKEDLINIFQETDTILGISETLIVLKHGIIFRYSKSYLAMEYQNRFLGDCYLGDFDNISQAIMYCISLAGLQISFTRNDLDILTKINIDLNSEECI